MKTQKSNHKLLVCVKSKHRLYNQHLARLKDVIWYMTGNAMMTDPTPRDDARFTCMAHGGRLAEVCDSKLNAALRLLLGSLPPGSLLFNLINSIFFSLFEFQFMIDNCNLM